MVSKKEAEQTAAQLCKQLGLPVVKVKIKEAIKGSGASLHTTFRHPDRGIICISPWLIHNLTRPELKALLAHELYHYKRANYPELYRLVHAVLHKTIEYANRATVLLFVPAAVLLCAGANWTGLPLLAAIWAFFTLYASREEERACDAYAKRVTSAKTFNALIYKLTAGDVDNFEYQIAPYTEVVSTHPSAQSRMK